MNSKVYTKVHREEIQQESIYVQGRMERRIAKNNYGKQTL